MARRGKVTKTEIFCLFLTAVFLLTVLGLFWTGRSSRAETGITVWKDTAEETAPQKININTADEDELQLLPGIGPVLARRIVAWREENGNYVIPEDLLAVDGIGLATLEDIRNMIVTEEAS